MPLYTFRCKRCAATVQVVHRFDEPHPTEHHGELAIPEFPFPIGVEQVHQAMDYRAPEQLYRIPIRYEQCNGELVRVWDVPNVIYVGSGFYTTDKVLYDHPTEMDIEDGSYDPYSP